MEKVRIVNQQGLGGIWPDYVVLLSVDPSTGSNRQKIADRIGAEPAEFLTQVASTYDSLAASEPERFIVIDASFRPTLSWRVCSTTIGGVTSRG